MLQEATDVGGKAFAVDVKIKDFGETNGNQQIVYDNRNDESLRPRHCHQERNHAPHLSPHAVDCVIIGSGASGLQCAFRIMEESPETTVLLLEARDRVGGRIFTTHETRRLCNRRYLGDESGDASKSFYRDLGAAWVHGIGGNVESIGMYAGTANKNPMVELLEAGSRDRQPARDIVYKSFSSSASILPSALYAIVEGNPWTRPDTILHKAGAIALFLNGKRIQNDSSLVSRAIQRHYTTLRRLSVYTNVHCQVRETYKTETLDAEEVRHDILESLRDEVDTHRENPFTSAKEPTSSSSSEEEDIVELLTPFYMFLIENWDGISSRDSQLGLVVNDKVAVSTSLTTDERYICAGDFDGPHCKVKTGMITVLAPLIEKVISSDNDVLRLCEKVTTIAERKDRGCVLIETNSGMVVEAKCCVCTIPLGCLQVAAKSLFEPILSEEKMEALESVCSGSYKKVFLTFGYIFWPTEEPFIGLVRTEKESEAQTATQNYYDRLPGNYLLLTNLWARDGIPCIEAVLSGDLGVWAFHKHDESIRNCVIEFLESAMGLSNLLSSCVGCHVTRWEEDEYTRGSYSSCRLDTRDRHVAALRRSEWNGRLIFAGESTVSEHIGSVHAALISGQRAAKDVFACLATVGTP